VNHQPGKPVRLLLYTTSGCHLCERAEALIQRRMDASLELVEIADDAALLERYGVRIPVLCRVDTHQELDWPFDGPAVDRLLAV